MRSIFQNIKEIVKFDEKEIKKMNSTFIFTYNEVVDIQTKMLCKQRELELSTDF